MNDDVSSTVGVANHVLRLVPAEERRSLLPRLQPVPLVIQTRLAEPGRPIDTIHFVESGMISMISVGENGEENEVGLIGAESVLGLPVLLGAETHELESMVQLDGLALALPSSELRRLLPTLPVLHGLMLRCVDAMHAQVTQTAVCNGRHQVEQRLARWILMAHDRAGADTFPMTHDFLARMLGVRRPSVTLAVGALQRAGVVQHQRHALTVLDRGGLEAISCECYEVVRSRTRRLAASPD